MNAILLIAPPGPTEWLIIAAIILLLFGPTQIPKLTKLFGKGVKNFKKGMAEAEEDDEDEEEEESKSDKKKKKKAKKSEEKETDEE